MAFFVFDGFWVRKCKTVVSFGVLGAQNVKLSSLLRFQRDRDKSLSSWFVVWILFVVFTRGRAACHGRRLASEATVHDAVIGKYIGRNSDCF